MTEAGGKPPAGGEDLIFAEHHRIRDLTQALEASGDLTELLEQLREFRLAIAQHFQREEATDGLYETVRSMSPRLIGRVDQLEKEHPTFLSEVDRVAARARACLTGPVAAVLAEAKALARRLADHEAREDEMLLDTLYTDLGQGE